jgi:hypothetical protein
LPTLGPKLRLRFVARPSSYSPVILPVVRACATFGATAEEIANYLNIPWGSFKRWVYAEPELREALKRGRDASDERVVDSLYQLAVGWKGSKPDLGACCFWLKNRRPSEWRDVQNIEANHAHYIVVDRPMSEEEWITARADRALPVSDASSPSVVQDESDTANPLE